MSGHRDTCPACEAWARSAQRQQEAFATLERLEVPDVLAPRVERELGGERLPRLVQILGAMIRHPAPSGLDERVAMLLRAPRAPRAEPLEVRALRALEFKRAPEVLSRLLEEELAEPERERAERFAGNLERLTAPEALEKRLGDTVLRRSLMRLVVAPLATLSAAGLVVWMTVRWVEPEAPTRRFEVVRLESPEDLHPLARALAETLDGGVQRRDAR